ncbi:MAG: biotin--[acetyl-CoA-carboxylase] ligase [Taibaiella sp.]|nr:biotin--[acetyl-CoA-carboxylase] ligase [Taibaiella sp.]
MSLLNAPIIELDAIDSTNNYAMRLIDADTALPGLTITARRQRAGKGQRGRQWTDVPDQSLLMSMVTVPVRPLEEQFIFNASVAIAIAEVLLEVYEQWDVRIKWPNDIIINDKKAGGVLIENVLRGNRWANSVIGLGLNVHQETFSSDLPFATSLKIEAGRDFDLHLLLTKLRKQIWEATRADSSVMDIMRQYNTLLYRKGKEQTFTDNNRDWSAIIVGTHASGTLQVQTEDGTISQYTHGVYTWKW